ncbi:hypothetical protein [Bradyrhizobium sp. Tv2a-2]|uniref:hypothetical protein n=1 Tax=Bradyrhizobium sp. Tv2a-2 TaxID=113395 RepID=UPI0012EC3A36|nr:hypothetical protein [Bradyrhizobium sp. Tv2a-2]
MSESKLKAGPNGAHVFRMPRFGFPNIEFGSFAKRGVVRAHEVGKPVRKRAAKALIGAS